MKLVSFASLVRLDTSTNSTTFTDADMLILANTYMASIAMDIKTANRDAFGVYAFKSLVAGQREYPLPQDMLSSFERIEAKLNGVDWHELVEVNLPLLRTATDEASIVSYMKDRKSAYDLFRNSAFIYNDSAIIDVTNGLKIWYTAFPSDLTNFSDDRDISVPADGTKIGFPREFHELLARRVTIHYKENLDIPRPLTQSEQMFDNDLRKAILSIQRPNYDRSVSMQFEPDNGEDY